MQDVPIKLSFGCEAPGTGLAHLNVPLALRMRCRDCRTRLYVLVTADTANTYSHVATQKLLHAVLSCVVLSLVVSEVHVQDRNHCKRDAAAVAVC